VRGRLRRVAAAGGHLRVTTAFAVGQLAHRQAGVVTIQHFDRAGASLGHATNRTADSPAWPATPSRQLRWPPEVTQAAGMPRMQSSAPRESG
jgi:hypothetical protein